MRIGAINTSFYTTNMLNSVRQLSAMRKINSAADNAAGLAIMEKLTSQYRGLDRVATNVREFRDLANIAEGGLSNISDSLQRIRELTVQASNTGVYTVEDRQIIQNEINQLREGISDMVKTGEYNGMKLLDGTFQDKFVTVNANGAGTKVSIDGMSLESLGIAGIDVTSDDPSKYLSMIDSAMAKVNYQRSELGAQVNRFDHTYNNSVNAAENMRVADANLAGMSFADIGRAITDFNTENLLNQINIIQTAKQNIMQDSILGLLY